MPNRAEVLKEKYQNSTGLPFAKVLPESEIQSVLDEQGIAYRQVLYTPMVVLWSCISQVLDVDGSLSHAVKRVVTWMSLAGLEPPSADTGGYSKAPERVNFSAPITASGAGVAAAGDARSTVVWSSGKGL